MALRYGFYLYPPSEWTEEKAKKEREKKWKKLNKEDKKFYNDGLCWICYMADIGFVSKKTIPHIIKRHNDFRNLYDSREKTQFLTEEYLSKFIGYEINVKTLTDKEFFKKLEKAYNLHKKDDCLKNKKQLEKTQAEFEKNVYGIEIRKSIH